MKDFKYRTTFTSFAEVIKPEKESLEAFASASSLEGLAGLFTTGEKEIHSEDLLWFTCNAANPNLANLNHDLILSEGAVKIAKGVRYKPTNLEHNRESIVGLTTNAGFSEYGTNKLISEEEVLATNKPVNLAVAGCLWKVVGDITDVIEEASSPLSKNYKKISVSWELGFNSYSVLLGSKDASKGIIKRGEDAKPYYKYLRAEGGAGVDDNGLEVYRVIEDGLFLGIGITTDPAASVEGILTFKSEEPIVEMEMPETPEVEEPEESESEDEEKTKVKIEIEIEANEDKEPIICPKCASAEAIDEEIVKKDEKSENKISTLESSAVTKIVTMKFNTVNDALASLREAEASFPTAKELREYFLSEFAKANELYEASQAEKEKAVAELQESITASQTSTAEIEALKAKIELMEAQAREKEASDIFDSRFSALAAEYDIEDAKVRASIAKQIKDLDEDGYQYWLANDGDVILANRIKSKPQVNVEEATASLKEATASIDIPNSQDVSDKEGISLADLAKEIQFKK